MDPWSKGDYSQVIREASMVVERLPVVILSSGRVPRRVLLVLPILEARRRRRNREEFAKKGSVLEGFGTRGKYRPKGGWGVAPGLQAATWHDRRGVVPPGRLDPWGAPLTLVRGSGRFLCTDFYWIFPDFWSNFN